VLFPGWETFYVIVGSSAGALTGLMFVVIALVADVPGTKRQLDAFGTPTVVHLSAALLLSVILTAPWPTRFAAQLALTTIGAAGTAYTVVVLRRARGQNDYRPVFEDWLFHAALPFASYVSVLAGALGMARLATACLFVIGGAAVLLLFIGIHNAWDTVTYVVIARWEARRAREGEPPDRAKAT
jgi:hypothetical protein